MDGGAGLAGKLFLTRLAGTWSKVPGFPGQAACRYGKRISLALQYGPLLKLEMQMGMTAGFLPGVFSWPADMGWIVGSLVMSSALLPMKGTLAFCDACQE